ncbi:hypothetical protein BKA82DRAFT_156661, partial [Pisolithus tinctorius]
QAHQAFEAMDKDIYETVMDMKKMWEELAKSGDVDDESDAPMCNEALQATLLLHKYTKALDNPFARKLETMLGSFGWRTCTGKILN